MTHSDLESTLLKKWIGWQTDKYRSTVIATMHRALQWSLSSSLRWRHILQMVSNAKQSLFNPRVLLVVRRSERAREMERVLPKQKTDLKPRNALAMVSSRWAWYHMREGEEVLVTPANRTTKGMRKRMEKISHRAEACRSVCYCIRNCTVYLQIHEAPWR